MNKERIKTTKKLLLISIFYPSILGAIVGSLITHFIFGIGIVPAISGGIIAIIVLTIVCAFTIDKNKWKMIFSKENIIDA
jgi:hypothetical protein